MSFDECQDLVDAYVEWLKQKINAKNIDGVCEITTPFLDRHNDHLQIYIKKAGDALILTDDGYIIRPEFIRCDEKRPHNTESCRV